MPVAIVMLAWLSISLPWSHVTLRRSSMGNDMMALRIATSTVAAVWS